MSKHEKELGIPSPSDRRRIDPVRPARRSAPSRKHYPRHWEVRDNSFGWLIVWDSKHKINDYQWLEHKELRKVRDLDAYLAIMAADFPETASWPVRFISMPPIPTTREVIQ